VADYHHTEGICLRRISYSNTSQVASFLTPDAGRLSVIAKGVTRAPKRGIRTGFDLLGRYELVYIARRPGSLQLLTYRWLKEPFRGMCEAPERILCGCCAAELATNFIAEGEPCPEYYNLTLDALRSFAAGRALGYNVLRLEVGALVQHGVCPIFDACVECGKALPAHGAVAFNAADGGPLCRECEEMLDDRASGRVITVRRDVLKAAARVRADLAAPPPADMTPQRIVATSRMLRFYMRDQLNKELRMWKYLDGRALSRSLQRLRRRAGVA